MEKISILLTHHFLHLIKSFDIEMFNQTLEHTVFWKLHCNEGLTQKVLVMNIEINANDV